MPQLTAFIARSFLPDDERRLKQVLSFLGTFEKMGFICKHAEAAEVQSVSAKVRELIDRSDVFIGIFTRRYPVYNLPPGIRGAWQAVRGIEPSLWSASAWVLQESGYALQKLGPKKLILLREPGVEVFGLQGDLEYVPFVPEKSAEVFSKLSEMINGLLAQAIGIEVRNVVIEKPIEKQSAAEAPPPAPEPEPPKDETAEPTIGVYLLQMMNAADAAEFGLLSEAWKAGGRLIDEGKVKDVDRLAWDSYFYDQRFRAGAVDALDNLQDLHTKNPSTAEPIEATARCLTSAGEPEKAALLFLKAAQLRSDRSKARNLVNAAQSFKEAKQYEKGKQAAYEALAIAAGDTRRDATWELYQILKEAGENYLSFATAEAALQDNPQLGLRFNLGLDYHREGLIELAFFHFKFICDRDNKNAEALHNLALMYADSKLPISAVQRYKTALDLGETLSAANLGFTYLDAGMADEARAILARAKEVESHDPKVDECSAEIIQRTQAESVKKDTLLATAHDKREFLAQMGQALHATTPVLEGRWIFPFGEMTLSRHGDSISGEAEIKTESSSYGAFAGMLGGGTPVPEAPKLEGYRIEGKLTGGVCEFRLTITDKTPRNPLVFAGLTGSRATSKTGFLVFEPNGKAALYAEVANQKIEKSETIRKIG
jgi:tetratricopeptide (TPR) repeat protein